MNDGAITVLRERMNSCRGRLFAAIEAIGLPQRQENAVKSLVRQTTYDVQGDVEAALKERQ